MSKEEIENMKLDILNLHHMLGKKTSISKNAIKNALKYIDKQESREQKLIEKLEEDKKIFGNYEKRKQMAKEQLYENDGKWFYCQEILSILKGEKHDN